MITAIIVACMATSAAAHAFGQNAPRVDCGGGLGSCLPETTRVAMWFDAMAPNADYGQGYHSPHHGQTATWYDMSPNGHNAVATTKDNSCHQMRMADDHLRRNGNCRGHEVVGCVADVPEAETQHLVVPGPVLGGANQFSLFLVAGTRTPVVTGTNPAILSDPSIMRIGDSLWIGLDEPAGGGLPVQACLYTQQACTTCDRARKCWPNKFRPSGTAWAAVNGNPGCSGADPNCDTATGIPRQGNPEANKETASGVYTALDLYQFDIDLTDIASSTLRRPFPVKALEGRKGRDNGLQDGLGNPRESFVTDIMEVEDQDNCAVKTTNPTSCDAITSGTPPGSITGTWNDAGWIIGSGSTGSTEKGNNFIAEYIVYDTTVSQTTVEIVSEYLINKWNLNDMDCTCNDHTQASSSHEDGVDCNNVAGCAGANAVDAECNQADLCCFQHTTQNCPPCGVCGNGAVERGESCDSASPSVPGSSYGGDFNIKAACETQAPGSCGGCNSQCMVQTCPGYGGAFWLFECTSEQYNGLLTTLSLSECPELPDGHPCEAWRACPATPFDMTTAGCVFIGNGEEPPYLTWHVAANSRLLHKQRAMAAEGKIVSKADVMGIANPAFNQQPSGFYLLWATHGLITGDPHFTSFSGGTYEILGVPDHVYNLISTPTLQYNAQFVAGGHNSTWIGAIGLVFDGHTVTWTASDNTATLDGQPLQVSTDKSTHPLGNGTYVSLSQAKHPAPTRMILRVPGYTIRLTRKQVSKVQYVPHGAHMKRQGKDKDYHWGARPWYFDQHIMRMGADKTKDQTHGLIGQTASFTKPVKSSIYHGRNRNRNGEGVIEGTVSDYEVSGLLKADSKFSLAKQQ